MYDIVSICINVYVREIRSFPALIFVTNIYSIYDCVYADVHVMCVLLCSCSVVTNMNAGKLIRLEWLLPKREIGKERREADGSWEESSSMMEKRTEKETR